MDIFARSLTPRLPLVVICVCSALFLIVGYLFHLQVNLMPNFLHLGKKNFLRSERIASPRGNIIDKNGNLLATNRPVTGIYWQGTGNKYLSSEQKKSIEELQNRGISTSEFEKTLAYAEKKAQLLCLVHDASFEQLSRVIEKFPCHANIIVDTHFKRHYPYKSIASHLVGYLSNPGINANGCMGLEHLFDEALKGEPGQRLNTINSVGCHLESQELKKALAGTTIETTLDLRLQLIAEELFPADSTGTFIVLDPQTGGLEALVSRPDFDPNIFLGQLGGEQWHALQEKKCFINRAFNACYPPASIFKLVTLSAALETKIIDQTTSWYCNGHTTFAGRDYHCARKEGHGSINTPLALAKSCNIPFFDIAKKIKIDTLADYAQRLGLGIKTAVLFPERSGLIPTCQWKRTVKKEPWWPGETLSAAIGQSYTLVTPLQVACMVSAFCEGYLVRPRILMVEPVVKQPLQLQKETIQFVKKCMHEVITLGSAKILARLKNFTLYGKSGTAQTSDLSKRNLGKQFVEHGWFAACFNYKNHKPLTLVILIENAGSSQVAIGIAYEFFKRYEELVETKISET
ncbi:hypothetical protein H0X48_02710 [Candidatus Dependentiae bacterium]|nr:hypothetical protein [Candidatus Dependentiae bacterium]